MKKNQPKPKNRKSKSIAIIIGLGSLSLLFLVAIFISYASFPAKILDKRIVFFVDNIFAQVPFLPKTPRQVLVRGILVSKNLDSYKIQSEIKLATETSNLILINSKGSIQNPGQPDSQSSARVKGNFSYPIVESFDFETYSRGENLYFKVNEGANIPPINTSSLDGWYRLDLSLIEKDVKVAVLSEEQISKDVGNEVNNLIDEFFDQPISKSNETIAGKTYYKLETTLKKNPLSRIFLSDSNATKSRLTIWVEKGTYFISEIQIEPVEKNQGLGFSFDYQISEHNQELDFEEPKGAKKINNPVELYVLLTGKKADANALFAAIGGEAKDLTTTLLTIERLTKVILLIPKAI